MTNRFVLDKRQVSLCGGFTDECYKKYWGKYHYATDYSAEYVPIYAWTKLFIDREYWGNEGGNWLECRDEKGNRFRLAHLKEYRVPAQRWVEAGTVIAISGNSGTRVNAAGQVVTYRPHLHFEWRRPDGRLDDPERYFDQLLTEKPMSDYNDRIIRQAEAGKPYAGGFALVVRGKKFIIPQEPGTLALLTFLQREDTGQFRGQIVNVDSKTWESIPTSPDLKF